MLIKAGVDISRLNREIRRTLPVLNSYALNHGEELIITSTFEGDHGAGSLHYANDAIDIRYLKSVKKEQQVIDIRALLIRRFGYIYDVVEEGSHIHIEHDTK